MTPRRCRWVSWPNLASSEGTKPSRDLWRRSRLRRGMRLYSGSAAISTQKYHMISGSSACRILYLIPKPKSRANWKCCNLSKISKSSPNCWTKAVFQTSTNSTPTTSNWIPLSPRSTKTARLTNCCWTTQKIRMRPPTLLISWRFLRYMSCRSRPKIGGTAKISIISSFCGMAHG